MEKKMYGHNPWGYPPQPPQYVYIPQYPAVPPGVQPISSSDEARRIWKEMKKNERKWKKEAEEALKKKEGDKKTEKKPRIDDYFATKVEVAFFMWLVSPGIAILNWVLLKYLFEHFV